MWQLLCIYKERRGRRQFPKTVTSTNTESYTVVEEERGTERVNGQTESEGFGNPGAGREERSAAFLQKSK